MKKDSFFLVIQKLCWLYILNPRSARKTDIARVPNVSPQRKMTNFFLPNHKVFKNEKGTITNNSAAYFHN
jgi:hypothetical protein